MFVSLSEISIFRIELNEIRNLNIDILFLRCGQLNTVAKLQLLICKTIYCWLKLNTS